VLVLTVSIKSLDGFDRLERIDGDEPDPQLIEQSIEFCSRYSLSSEYRNSSFDVGDDGHFRRRGTIQENADVLIAFRFAENDSADDRRVDDHMPYCGRPSAS
jgi:hypothetical protein